VETNHGRRNCNDERLRVEEQNKNGVKGGYLKRYIKERSREKVEKDKQ
jgi:hypothetical protein